MLVLLIEAYTLLKENLVIILIDYKKRNFWKEIKTRIFKTLLEFQECDIDIKSLSKKPTESLQDLIWTSIFQKAPLLKELKAHIFENDIFGMLKALDIIKLIRSLFFYERDHWHICGLANLAEMTWMFTKYVKIKRYICLESIKETGRWWVRKIFVAA